MSKSRTKNVYRWVIIAFALFEVLSWPFSVRKNASLIKKYSPLSRMQNVLFVFSFSANDSFSSLSISYVQSHRQHSSLKRAERLCPYSICYCWNSSDWCSRSGRRESVRLWYSFKNQFGLEFPIFFCNYWFEIMSFSWLNNRIFWSRSSPICMKFFQFKNNQMLFQVLKFTSLLKTSSKHNLKFLNKVWNSLNHRLSYSHSLVSIF